MSAVRVNAAQLPLHQGETVLLVGKVINQQGSNAQLETSDKQVVTVHTRAESRYSTAFVEVKGIINPDNTVNELSFTSFGDVFDLNNYNQAVELMAGKYKTLFA